MAIGICWWCGNRLVNIHGRAVAGRPYMLPRSTDQVRVHAVCESAAEAYADEINTTAAPSITPIDLDELGITEFPGE